MNIWTRTSHILMISVTQTPNAIFILCAQNRQVRTLFLVKAWIQEKEMFLCLISLPRILRENVSTNIKATVWTTAAVPNHLPSPSLTWWVPLPSARLRFTSSALKVFIQILTSSHSLSRRKGANKVWGVTKDPVDNLLSTVCKTLSLSSSQHPFFEWPQSRWKRTNWLPHTRH